MARFARNVSPPLHVHHAAGKNRCPRPQGPLTRMPRSATRTFQIDEARLRLPALPSLPHAFLNLTEQDRQVVLSSPRPAATSTPKFSAPQLQNWRDQPDDDRGVLRRVRHEHLLRTPPRAPTEGPHRSVPRAWENWPTQPPRRLSRSLVVQATSRCRSIPGIDNLCESA